MPLIACTDHGEDQIGVVLCVHLHQGLSTDWHPILSGAEDVADDWLCPKCLELSERGRLGIADIRTVCVQCVEYLQGADGVVIHEPLT